MIRDTSRAAYEMIKENGLLSKRRFEVYAYVFEHGPCSARDCHKALAPQGINYSSFGGRFSELRELGVLKEVGKKYDNETGNTVILWDVTSEVPIDKQAAKLNNLVKKAARLERQLAEVREELISVEIKEENVV